MHCLYITKEVHKALLDKKHKLTQNALNMYNEGYIDIDEEWNAIPGRYYTYRKI